MSSAQYLYRRASGIYSVRFCVPERLQTAVGKTELHRTTGCRDWRLAKIVAAELTAHWHRAIQTLDGMDITKIKAGSISLLGDGFVTLLDAASALGSTPLNLATQLTSGSAYLYVQAKNWLGWAVPDIYEALDHEVDEMGQVSYVLDLNKLGGVGAQITFSGRLRLRFQDEGLSVIESGPQAISQFIQWPTTERGFLIDLPGQSIGVAMLEVRKVDVESLRTRLESQVTPEMYAEHQRTQDLLFQAAGPKSMKLSEFIAYHLEHLGKTWKEDQRRRRKDQLQMFLELMGDLSLNAINRGEMRSFSSKLSQVPDERHLVKHRYKCPGASFLELIELADLHGLPRLTTRARMLVLSGLCEAFAWARQEGELAFNPAEGLSDELSKSREDIKKPHEQRDLISSENLASIFAVKWFKHGVGQRTPKGDFYAYSPHYYWLPLMALYCGGRLNELSQLHLSDVKELNGIAYLHFNLLGSDKLDLDPSGSGDSGTKKSLKTISSERLIPIHQRLIDLGLLEYVNALRARDFPRLFPELRFDKHKGYGKAAGSWFNERFLGNELKIPRSTGQSFHSLRHNFATSIGTLDLPSISNSDLMGHSRGSEMFKRYDKGPGLALLKGFVDQISHELPDVAPFNVEAGLEAVHSALKRKERRADALKKLSQPTKA